MGRAWPAIAPTSMASARPEAPLGAKTCPDACHSRKCALRAAWVALAVVGAFRSTVLYGSGL